MKILEGRLKRAVQTSQWPAPGVLRRAANPVMIFMEDWRNAAIRRGITARLGRCVARPGWNMYLGRKAMYFLRPAVPPGLRSRCRNVLDATQHMLMPHHRDELIDKLPPPWNDRRYYDEMFLGRHRLLPHSGVRNVQTGIRSPG